MFENRKIETIIYRLHIQACFVFLVAVFSSAPPQTMGSFLKSSVARRKCLCVSREVALWSSHFDIRLLVPMFCLKLCNHIYIYIEREREREKEREIRIHIYHTVVKELASLLRNYHFCLRKFIIRFENKMFLFENMVCLRKFVFVSEIRFFVRKYDLPNITIYMHGAH